MTEQERELILNLADNSITTERFYEIYPESIKGDRNYVLNQITKAYSEKDAEDLEYAILLGFSIDVFSNDYVDVLCKVLVEEWHRQHENIAMVLQKLKSPKSVDSLSKAMETNFDYLAYNDCEALIIKCAWALGDINTDYSKERLKLLSGSNNSIVANAASYQLNR